jgi:plasmid stability protein
MGVIHIENVDEQVMKSIRLNAERHGRSFEDEVKAVLTEASMTPKDVEQTDSTEIIRQLRERARADELPAMSPEEFAAEAARIRAMTPKAAVQTDSTDIIRELRDRGYAGR